jgi:hypothetical protein
MKCYPSVLTGSLPVLALMASICAVSQGRVRSQDAVSSVTGAEVVKPNENTSTTDIDLKHDAKRYYPPHWSTFDGMSTEVNLPVPTVFVVQCSATFYGHICGPEFGLRLALDENKSLAETFRIVGDGPSVIEFAKLVVIPAGRHRISLQGATTKSSTQERPTFHVTTFHAEGFRCQGFALAREADMVVLRADGTRSVAAPARAVEKVQALADKLQILAEDLERQHAVREEEMTQRIAKRLLSDPEFRRGLKGLEAPAVRK